MLVTGQGVIDWMIAQGHEYQSREATALGWHDGKSLVAGVAYTDFNGSNLCMHVVASPGRRWLRREFLWACFDYPFNQCKVRRVTGLVAASNRQARKFDEHLGFVFETTLEKAHPTGDLLVYRMFREECRWIGLNQKSQHKRAA